MNKKFLMPLIVVSGLSWAEIAVARPAAPADADGVTESSVREIEIDSDGSYTSRTESVVQILREGGRSMSTYHLSYNSRSTKLEVLEAETINDGKRFAVEREFIEDKPQASRLNGFDQMNTVAIAFPRVTIGSKLHLKYLEKVKEVPVEGHFSMRFDFGTNWYTKSRSVRLSSRVPLFVQLNDPQKKLSLNETKEGNRFVVSISMREPIYTAAVDEPWARIAKSDQTWAVVTSSRSYGEIGDSVAGKIEEVLAAELPPLLDAIRKEAEKQGSLVAKINTITSKLAEQVRYMGDWRPIKGGHVPRPLETTAATRFGDCKDFSAATIAVLRKLGIKAQMAWVERAGQPTPLPELGLMSAFNHAIVHIERPDGKSLWVDPTNFASFAQGVFDDIADRPALVLRTGGSKLAMIPAQSPSSAVRETIARINLERSGDATIHTRLVYRGRMAAHYTGLELRQSKEHIDHRILTSLTDESRLKWSKIAPYELRSRVTSDFSLDVEHGERDFSLRTTVGPAFHLDSRNVDFLVKLDTRKRVSELFLGQPDLLRTTEVYVGARVVGEAPPQCKLDSPWLFVSRQVSQSPEGLRITDTREIKKSLITNAELKSEPFAKFQRALIKCFDRVAVVYKREPRPAPRAISSEH